MKRERLTDPIVAALENAFAPGLFIPDQGCFEFIFDLQTAIQPIEVLLDTDPQRATSLFETALAGCYLKAEELDDSSGSFGIFIREVVIHWINARQKAGADALATASTVLNWMDDDPDGFCSGLETELSAVLNASGLVAFESLLQGRCEADPDDRRWQSLLRQIYFRQKRADAYEGLANEAGFPSEDCLALAQMHAEADPAVALQWIERGLTSAGTESHSAALYVLLPLRRKLLASVGRSEEALASAWSDFLKHSNKQTLDELLRYAPADEREAWRKQALDQAKGHLKAMMELLVKAGEQNRLAKLTESVSDTVLEGVSHLITEPAATLLESAHPFPAARLWRAQALRIVNAGKSKYYDAAIDNLERARDCFLQAGRDAEWKRTALEISRAHSRKQGFIRDFASVVRGERIVRLSFLEIAMMKWQNRSTQ
jgi:hypothetical protein